MAYRPGGFRGTGCPGGCCHAGGNACRAASSRFSAFLVCALFTVLNITMERLLGAWVKSSWQTKVAEVFFTIFVLAMVSLQFLNPLMQKYGHALVPMLRSWVPYLWLLPSSFAGDAGCSISRSPLGYGLF